MKLFTCILGQRILSALSEDLRGFRKKSKNAVYVVRELIEQAIEYNKPAYMYFIDLTRAFDRIQFEHVADELGPRRIHPNIVETTIQLNAGNTTLIKTRTTSTEEVNIKAGVR
ncbi:hypothetical protein Trydic_g7919 [Trypoxylus dichotomus]